MTNRTHLENTIKTRNSMLDYITQRPDLELESLLKLNNEIALITNRIKTMKQYDYLKLRESATFWELELKSKMNEENYIPDQ